jgi:hypothetical protein
MRNGLMTQAMWILFAPTFKKHLPIIGVSDSNGVMGKAREKYRAIIEIIPPFGRNDVLILNLISAAEIAAIYLGLDPKPSCEKMKEYYGTSMDDSRIMRMYLRSINNYSEKYQKSLAKQAKVSQLSDNPYSWRFKFLPGKSLDTFDAVFDRCGIHHLFCTLGISEITPAMCAYDYGMAKWTNTIFTRENTLGSGGSVCDCHYRNARQHRKEK